MGQTAVVTGSSRGIGRGIAVSLAEAGYDIMVNYSRNEEAADDAAREVRDRGVEAGICQADIADTDQGRRLIDSTLDRFGRLDLLVNNAGIAPRVRADILEAESESYDEVMSCLLYTSPSPRD